MAHDDSERSTEEVREHRQDGAEAERQSSDDGTVWWFIAATFAFILPESLDADESVQTIGFWLGVVLILVGSVFLVRRLRRER